MLYKTEKSKGICKKKNYYHLKSQNSWKLIFVKKENVQITQVSKFCFNKNYDLISQEFLEHAAAKGILQMSRVIGILLDFLEVD